MIMLKLGVIIENESNVDEIGEYLAKDIVGALYNGDDVLDVVYLGSDKVENP